MCRLAERGAGWWQRRYSRVVDTEELQDAAAPGGDGAVVEAPAPARCAPLRSPSALLAWRPRPRDTRASRVPLTPRAEGAARPKLLVCHDLQGGYGADADLERALLPPGEPGYRIWHWASIDTFVYFSHHLVTIPPRGWVEAAHTHGAKCLGTFITEFKLGEGRCARLFGTRAAAEATARQLATIAAHFGFEGWLVNIENPLPRAQVANVLHFLARLRALLRQGVGPRAEVIWYDAVAASGRLRRQSELVPSNAPFFDACDGIFLDYKWKGEGLLRSAAAARGRACAVYAGCDAFGRGVHAGGHRTAQAVAAARAAGVSAALFAPGWVYECNDRSGFEQLQERWWRGIEAAWGLRRPFDCRLPLATSFNCGAGRALFALGAVIDPRPWLHLASTQLLPTGVDALEVPDGAPRLLLRLTTQTAYEGGSCVVALLKPQQLKGPLHPQRGAAVTWEQDSRIQGFNEAQLMDLSVPLAPGKGLLVECTARLLCCPLVRLALVLQLAAGHGSAARVALLMDSPGAGVASRGGAAPGPAGDAWVSPGGPPEDAGGGWRRWSWSVPGARLEGAAVIRGCIVAAWVKGGAWAAAGAAAAAESPAGGLLLIGRLAIREAP